MKGTVLNIQRFCTRDGPGIRTTVFLKGCPLHCLWCHNPESQSQTPQMLYDAEKCVSCGRCVTACEQGCHTVVGQMHSIDREHCIVCGKCLSPMCLALELAGESMSVEQIMAEVLRDQPFYDNSGGGLTLSGGEPLYQTDFCLELLKGAKEKGLHVCMETCGLCDPEILKKLAPLVDIFLFDYKESDPARHKRYTGVDNRQILENLCLLDQLHSTVLLRCPIIPGLNDRQEHFSAIGQLAERLPCIAEIAVEPYHAFGAGKYRRLGRAYSLSEIDAPDSAAVDLWIGVIGAHTSKKITKA